MEEASIVMDKCTTSCFMSMKENTLLATEERCLRNCFQKTFDFKNYYNRQAQYAFRNLHQKNWFNWVSYWVELASISNVVDRSWNFLTRKKRERCKARDSMKMTLRLVNITECKQSARVLPEIEKVINNKKTAHFTYLNNLTVHQKFAISLSTFFLVVLCHIYFKPQTFYSRLFWLQETLLLYI